MKFFIMLLILISNSIYAQINVVVPFSVGGPADRIARIYTEILNENDSLTKYFVENIVGAGGTIASKRVIENKQSMLYVSSPAIFVGNSLPDQYLPKGFKFDILKDIEFVSTLGWFPIVLMSNQSSLSSLSPKHFFGHAGIGSSSHLMLSLLNQNYKFTFQSVAYKGSSDSIIALIRNEIQYDFHFIKEAMVYDGQKNIKALAIASTKRNNKLPNVPTFLELGIQNFENARGVHNLFANKSTPQSTIRKIQSIINNSKLSNQQLINFADNEGLVIEKISNEKEVFMKDAEFWKKLTIQAIK